RLARSTRRPMSEPLTTSGRRWLSVSGLSAMLGELLDREVGTVWVRAEVGAVTLARSGHAYFCVKDHSAQLQCVAFRSTLARLRFKLIEGSEILLRARAGIYAARGDLQLVVDYAEPVGVGSLQAEFER